MVTSKEVMAALETNPAYSKISAEETFHAAQNDPEALSPAYYENAGNMKEMGLDLDECVEELGDYVAKGFVLTTTVTRDPVGAAVSLFFWGLQVGFQLGRGYVEDES